MQLAIVIVSVNEGDFLRVTLPRTRRALPDAKTFVVCCADDGETQAVATAMRAQTIVVQRDVITKDGAVFNFAALARLGQEQAAAALKIPIWTIVTRAQVCLDSSIGAIDLTDLQQDSVYGCGMKEVSSVVQLASFQALEPTPEEVRTLVPDSMFLMSLGNGPKFDVWSNNTADAVTRFLNNFQSKYMIQKKLACLGILNADVDGRVTSRWGDPRAKVRIAPVHPATSDKPKEEAKPLEEKKLEEAKPADAKPSEEKKVDEAKPGDAKPADAKPSEEKKVEEAKPGDAKPADAKPSEEKKVEEAKPADAKPSEEKKVEEAKPAKTNAWNANRFAKRAIVLPESEEDGVARLHAQKEAQVHENIPLFNQTELQEISASQNRFMKKISNPWSQVQTFDSN